MGSHVYLPASFLLYWFHLKVYMEDLFQTALGITAPWYIESLKFNAEQSRLDIFINFQRGATFRDNEEDDPSKA